MVTKQTHSRQLIRRSTQVDAVGCVVQKSAIARVSGFWAVRSAHCFLHPTTFLTLTVTQHAARFTDCAPNQALWPALLFSIFHLTSFMCTRCESGDFFVACDRNSFTKLCYRPALACSVEGTCLTMNIPHLRAPQDPARHRIPAHRLQQVPACRRLGLPRRTALAGLQQPLL